MKLGEKLIALNKLSARDIERALLAQQEMGGYLGQVLVKLGLVSEQDIMQVLSEQLNVRLVTASDYPSEPVVIEELSEQFLFSNSVVPLAAGDTPEFAAVIPQDDYLRKAISLALGRPVSIHLGYEADIAAALERRRQSEEPEEDEQEAELAAADTDDEFVEHLKDLASEAPVIRLVNQIIHQALDLGASDIHIEPFEDQLHLRYRVDGVISDVSDPPPLHLAPAIASRIKLLSHMNIAERRLPQDGRIMTRVKGHELDMRVSTIPTVHGESIVMRVLDRDGVQLSLSSMGFSEDTLAKYTELLNRPHGILLVTGRPVRGKQPL